MATVRQGVSVSLVYIYIYIYIYILCVLVCVSLTFFNIVFVIRYNNFTSQLCFLKYLCRFWSHYEANDTSSGTSHV